MLKSLPRHELYNVLTHGLGFILSLIGIPFLFFKINSSITPTELIGISAFSFGLLAVYLASTTYHLSTNPRSKELWRIVDHIAIYFLIGGSYTAYILKYYDQPDGWMFLGVHWLLIPIGILMKIFFTGRFEIVSLLLYLVLGWMAVLIVEALTANMAKDVWYLILCGGLSYTIGIVFYVWEPHPINHAIWHIFVLGGSIFHFFGLIVAN